MKNTKIDQLSQISVLQRISIEIRFLFCFLGKPNWFALNNRLCVCDSVGLVYFTLVTWKITNQFNQLHDDVLHSRQTYRRLFSMYDLWSFDCSKLSYRVREHWVYNKKRSTHLPLCKPPPPSKKLSYMHRRCMFCYCFIRLRSKLHIIKRKQQQ